MTESSVSFVFGIGCCELCNRVSAVTYFNDLWLPFLSRGVVMRFHGGPAEFLVEYADRTSLRCHLQYGQGGETSDEWERLSPLWPLYGQVTWF